MKPNFEDVLALLREKARAARGRADVVFVEAQALGGLAADVGAYAARRLCERYLDGRAGPHPLETALNQIVHDATSGLIEAKKAVAVAIADEKRLAKQVEQETENAAEWDRRAVLAKDAGGEALAHEARTRAAEHRALAAEIQREWAQRKDDVERLKEALRALNSQIERAKRDKNKILARRSVARARAETRLQLERIDDAIRLLEHLGQAEALLDGEPGEQGQGNGSLH